MSEPTITHHVVDRPKLLSGHSFEGRVYVQPQWVYDCVNAGKLLPVEPYSMNAILPPHLSPFVEYQPGDYVPGERDAEDEAEEDAEEAEVWAALLQCPCVFQRAGFASMKVTSECARPRAQGTEE